MGKRMLYEVEARVYFDSEEEAFGRLAFLHECLTKKVEFDTRMYGIELFNCGKILRVTYVQDNNTTRGYLGYKEPDIGKIFNVRNEIDEEITCGITESSILQYIEGINKTVNIRNIDELLESLGHKQFLTLTGTNLTGYYEKLKMDFKLMQCSELRYPLLLEIEKSAETIGEAFRHELELQKFITENKLEDRVVQEEPPTLLKNRYVKT